MEKAFERWVAEVSRADPLWVARLSWSRGVRRWWAARLRGPLLLVCAGYFWIVFCAVAGLPFGVVGFAAALAGCAGVVRVLLATPPPVRRRPD